MARLLGRERNPCQHTPRAQALDMIRYTAKRDAIGTAGASIAVTGRTGGFAPRWAGPVGAGSPASPPHRQRDPVDPRRGLRDARR